MKASELNCSLLIEESQNSSFLILASDKKAENHAKKGKEGGIPKIEGSGRKEGGEEKNNGCILSFYIGYLFGDTVVFETKNW